MILLDIALVLWIAFGALVVSAGALGAIFSILDGLVVLRNQSETDHRQRLRAIGSARMARAILFVCAVGLPALGLILWQRGGRVGALFACGGGLLLAGMAARLRSLMHRRLFDWFGTPGHRGRLPGGGGGAKRVGG